METFDSQPRYFMLSTVNSFKLIIEIFVKSSNIHTMLYSSEYQIMKYFPAMLCQNVVPQNKMKNLNKVKNLNDRNLCGMFRLIFLIYGKNAKKYVLKFVWSNLRNSMKKYRFLEQVQNTELINWEWSEIPHAAQKKFFSKMYCPDMLWQYPDIKLSFIFQFQLVPFAFILILEDPLILFLLWLQ